jgi:hypothetical protein
MDIAALRYFSETARPRENLYTVIDYCRRYDC